MLREEQKTFARPELFSFWTQCGLDGRSPSPEPATSSAGLNSLRCAFCIGRTRVTGSGGLIRFRAFQAETICGDAFTQTIEKGCGKKSRKHCAGKETSLRSSESYCLMEESNTWKQTPIMNFPHSARYSRSFAQTST